MTRELLGTGRERRNAAQHALTPRRWQSIYRI